MTALARRLNMSELRLKFVGAAMFGTLALVALAIALFVARDRADASTVNVKFNDAKAGQ